MLATSGIAVAISWSSEAKVTFLEIVQQSLHSLCFHLVIQRCISSKPETLQGVSLPGELYEAVIPALQLLISNRFKRLQSGVLATGLSAAVALGAITTSSSVQADARDDIESRGTLPRQCKSLLAVNTAHGPATLPPCQSAAWLQSAHALAAPVPGCNALRYPLSANPQASPRTPHRHAVARSGRRLCDR